MFDVTPVCADTHVVNHQTGEVACIPKRKKVAIVGFASNTLHLVPYDDPDFEVWGMNQGYMHMARRADRWFEMHMPEATADLRDPEYLTWLTQCPIPVYMIQHYDHIPNSVRFPLEEAFHLAGRDYFMSSVAFMLCLAALEGFQEVHLYGINLAIGDEYFYEKPNAEWWIGKLEGMGIKVYVPSASALLKQHRRYGYSIDARPAQSLKVLLQSRQGEYRHKAELQSNELHILLGAMRECEALMQIMEGIDHGADLVLQPYIPKPPAPAST